LRGGAARLLQRGKTGTLAAMGTAVRLLTVVGLLLLGASLLFVWQSSYEVLYLTAAYGPQMLFFSVIHTWPGWLVELFFASWFAYYGLALFILVISLLGFFAPFRAHPSFIKAARLALLLIGLHLAVIHTYDYWAGPLFGS
jgi:hypothetical protein